MKRRFIHTLLFFLLSTFLSAGIAYAQDSGNPSDNNYPASNDEKAVYSPGGEGDPIVNTSKGAANASNRDSVTTRPAIRTNPAAEPTKVTKQAPQDDSVLSFNFLYYIIRKYKLQDMID